jgi:DNA-binding response OmpR family regulator
LKHVLIIEDDRSVGDSFAKALAHAGYQATVTDNVVAAVEQLKARSFNAIICDVILPSIEGTALYERLAEHFPAAADRVLFVTGWGKDSRVIRLLEGSGRPFLQKPVALEELIGAVRAIAGP